MHAGRDVAAPDDEAAVPALFPDGPARTIEPDIAAVGVAESEGFALPPGLEGLRERRLHPFAVLWMHVVGHFAADDMVGIVTENAFDGGGHILKNAVLVQEGNDIDHVVENDLLQGCRASRIDQRSCGAGIETEFFSEFAFP